jgi:magnesium-transporting ATPase (P-type)
MFIYKIELIGAVYMITAVIILFSAIIRLIPLLKTTKSKRARLILLIQCLIHITIGAYLILAAFYHWDKWNQLLADDARGNTLEELYKMSGEKFAEFNVQAYAYILVIFFYTLAMGYFWFTIEFKENSKSTLFWLNFVSITLAVVIAFLAPQAWFDAEKLVIALAILALFGALVIGGEATGGYIRYRKEIAGDIKKKEKKTEVGKEAPSRKDDTEISDIDPNIIPKDDPRDEDSVVS